MTLPARRKSIYLLPNLFTTGCLFSGFVAIVMALQGQFVEAAVAIVVAMVLDSLDGRVARLTNTTSDFGAQYDSLADMVAFGVAPALICYAWALEPLGRLGWIGAFLYVVGAALRLARFNTLIAIVDKRYFQGLPSPAAAALIASAVWILNDPSAGGRIELTGVTLSWFVWVLGVTAGLAMVSTLPYYSFKDLSLRRPVPFVALLALVGAVAIIAHDPPTMLFLLMVAYLVSGPVLLLKKTISNRRSIG